MQNFQDQNMFILKRQKPTKKRKQVDKICQKQIFIIYLMNSNSVQNYYIYFKTFYNF